MTFLDAPEPVEVTWHQDSIGVIWGIEREWWSEKIAYRAKVMA